STVITPTNVNDQPVSDGPQPNFSCVKNIQTAGSESCAIWYRKTANNNPVIIGRCARLFMAPNGLARDQSNARRFSRASVSGNTNQPNETLASASAAAAKNGARAPKYSATKPPI